MQRVVTGRALSRLYGISSTAALANPIGGGIHPLQGFVDLLEQLPFALSNAHGKILVDLGGCLVADIGKCLEVASMCQDFSDLIQDGCALAFKITADVGIFRFLGNCSRSFTRHRTRVAGTVLRRFGRRSTFTGSGVFS